MKIKISNELLNDDNLLNELKKNNIEIDELSPYEIISTTFDNYKTIKGEVAEGLVILDFKEIEYFEAIKNEVFAIKDNEKYKIKYKLYQVEEMYEDKGFIRVSKSFVVNVRKIQSIKRYISSKYILYMNNKEELDVNRSYYKIFKERLGL